MRTKSIIILIAAMGLALVACQKQTPLEITSVEAANDAAFTETVFDDVFSTLDISSLYMESAAKTKAVIDTCPYISISYPEVGEWPRTLTIDYGTSCTGLDNIVRSGKIIISVTAPRAQTGSIRSITFDGYYFNGIKIEGTKTVENLGTNDNGNVVMSVKLTGGKVILPDESYISLEFNREREYISGFNTHYFWDDECLITGYATGTGLNGKSFTHTITSALDWKAVCRFIVSGTIKLEVQGIEPFTLDYGNGDCDNLATLTRGDESKEITLGLYHPKMPVGK
jgi:hypothetical protein